MPECKRFLFSVFFRVEYINWIMFISGPLISILLKFNGCPRSMRSYWQRYMKWLLKEKNNLFNILLDIYFYIMYLSVLTESMLFWSFIFRMIWIQLVPMIIQIRLGTSSSVTRLVTFIFRVVGVALAWFIVVTGFTTSSRHFGLKQTINNFTIVFFKFENSNVFFMIVVAFDKQYSNIVT